MGPDCYVMPLSLLDGFSFKTGRKADGNRPVVDRSEQLWTDLGIEEHEPIAGGGVADDAPSTTNVKFPMKEAYDKAEKTVDSIQLGDVLSGGNATGSKPPQTGAQGASSGGGFFVIIRNCWSR